MEVSLPRPKEMAANFCLQRAAFRCSFCYWDSSINGNCFNHSVLANYQGGAV